MAAVFLWVMFMTRWQGNVVVTRAGRAVLVDVGMGRLTTLNPNERIRIPPTWPYMAPEELCPFNYGTAVPVVQTMAMDVYSFAATSHAVSHSAIRPVITLTRSSYTA